LVHIKDAGDPHNRNLDVMIKLFYAKSLNNNKDEKAISKGPNLPDIPGNFWKNYDNLELWKQISPTKLLPERLQDNKFKTLTNVEPTVLCWEWNIPNDESFVVDSQIGLLVVIDSLQDPIPEQNKNIFNVENLIRNEKHIGIRVLKLEK
jgi:hypothetical protein